MTPPFHAPTLKADDLTPEVVNKVWFDSTITPWIGRLLAIPTGYDEDQVDAFLDEVEQRLVDLMRERDQAREELNEMRSILELPEVEWLK